MPGWRWASPSRSCLRFRRLFRHRDRARPSVRRQAAVQFQRTVPFDQHPGFLAALAHHADGVPARLFVSIRWSTSRILPRRLSAAVFRRHGADHVALRPSARPKLDLRAMAERRTAAPWSFTRSWRRYGPRLPSLAGWVADGNLRLADRCDLPRRDGGGRLEHLSGPGHAT